MEAIRKNAVKGSESFPFPATASHAHHGTTIYSKAMSVICVCALLFFIFLGSFLNTPGWSTSCIA